MKKEEEKKRTQNECSWRKLTFSRKSWKLMEENDDKIVEAVK